MKRRRIIIVVAGLCLVIVLVWLGEPSRELFSPGADRLLLLVPDSIRFSDPRVTVWLDAASEEGLHVIAVHDSDFLRPRFGKLQGSGLILPDSVHQQASDLFVNAIRHYVATGGKLLLVYDAGTLSLEGRYAGDRSRLSDLAGVDYGLYDTLRDKTIQWSEVSGTITTMDQLGFPPGKYYPFSSQKTAASALTNHTVEARLRNYKYGELEYPSFVTVGAYSGQVLLRSSAGIVAGYHGYEKGSVLFVNLPLGYLKGNTDGLPLHSFLKYFALQAFPLPYLMSVPDGVGGLVLNWHIDSNAAIRPLQEINSWTLLQQGTYSIHITAGPDSTAFGDKRGFDVAHNSVSQNLIHKYVLLGDEIGSHGGWIHDYFALHVEKDNPKDLEQFLELNKTALEQVTGKPIVEYSAPNGNQPQWVTRWLESHGFVAYYFTGNTGMGPTQGYRDGQRAGETTWAFPILHLDRAAAFEEMSSQGYSKAQVEQWLDAVTHFAVSRRQVRLIYFHPPGIAPYRRVVQDWWGKTTQLKTQGRFCWYTMAQVAKFLNSRKQVRWKFSEHDRQALIQATHPQTLAHQTWWLPMSRFSDPKVIQGSATVLGDSDGWLIVAGEGKDLEVKARILPK